MVELHSLLSEAQKSRTAIVAVAPDSLEKIQEIVPKVKAKSGKEFAVLLASDADHVVIDRYGLLNAEAAARGRFLPHPTTYLIDAQGVVRWKFTETDYKIRPENRQIAAELEKIQK